MSKIARSPSSLAGVPALEYIDALGKAGDDGIGLRMYASPGVNSASVTQPLGGKSGADTRRQHALASSGLILYDILSYYIRPGFDLARMLASLEFGAELGLPYALAIADDPDWSRQRDNFAALCDAAATLGMTVSLEAPVGQNAVNTQIDDGVDADGPPPRGRREPGLGMAPLYDILDALPPGLPLSVEWGRPKDAGYSAAEWARIALEATRRFVDGYDASAARRGRASHGRG